MLSTEGLFGEGERWDYALKDLNRKILITALSFLIFCVFIVLIIIKIYKTRKKLKYITETAPEVNLENIHLSPREKEICKLLLTDSPMKEIAYALKLTYSGVNFHAQNLYRKLGIQSRTELLVKFGKNLGKEA